MDFSTDWKSKMASNERLNKKLDPMVAHYKLRILMKMIKTN
jgi:hypothetical protein